MDTLPIFLRLQGRQCLIIGGGNVALRKIELLRRAGAHITIVAPTLHPALQQLLEQNPDSMQHLKETFQTTQLDNKVLVIAATDDMATNRDVHKHAMSRNIPVNVVDQPELCSFIFPSIVDRSPIIIATSSGGRAPVLARLLRAKLESIIPASYGKLARIAGNFRDELKQHLPSITARRYFWESIFNGPASDKIISASDDNEGREILVQQLAESTDALKSPIGEAYIVGAGPGDPDLLTFRALRLMQQADVILYDRLVSPAVLDLVRRDADKIYVGKRHDHHEKTQTEINQLLIDIARDGKRVCRLKGGDPFIFGRGGEEIEALAAANINFQVVPGITAALGCAAYAGIPLTHRDYSQSCIFVTGHLKNNELALQGDLSWAALAQSNQTIIFYMGLKNLPLISKHLQNNGMPATTPAAIIENGTAEQQRVISAEITNLYEQATAADIKAPALIIIGKVVSLQKKLSWFHRTSSIN